VPWTFIAAPIFAPPFGSVDFGRPVDDFGLLSAPHADGIIDPSATANPLIDLYEQSGLEYYLREFFRPVNL